MQVHDAPLTERFGLRWSLAQALVRIGDLDRAIDLFGQCEQLCRTHPDQASGWLPDAVARAAALGRR